MLARQIVVIGTFDPAKPRARILLGGLQARGVPMHVINVPIWQGVRDKGLLTAAEKLRAAARQLLALPRLAISYLRAPRHDVVLIPYPGIFESLVIAPLAVLRGARVAWDIFISAYDTIVNDRRTHPAWHPIAMALFVAEWCAARMVAWPFLDTAAHARRFEGLMELQEGSVGSVPLGTDPSQFPRATPLGERSGPLRVLFYGQYIPLHGMETIVRAARRLEDAGVAVEFTLAGTGQEQGRVDALIAELGVKSVRQLGWIPAAELPGLMRRSDVGLGIFGTSTKALSVIPNKVYEMAAAQMPFVSGDTPAMREFAPGHPWARLVHPGDDSALAKALSDIAVRGFEQSAVELPVVGPEEVADAFLAIVGGGK